MAAWLILLTSLVYVVTAVFSASGAFSKLQCEMGTTVEDVCVGETDDFDVGDVPGLVLSIIVGLFQLLTFGGIGFPAVLRLFLTLVVGGGWIFGLISALTS